MAALRRLAVFCGSSPGRSGVYLPAAAELGRLLAGRGIELVYGGGRVGMMGALADAVLAGGGLVTGVIPRGLFDREVVHRSVTELVEVSSMHERKALMYDRADAFAGLPGGFGTLDEIAEVTTWAQLGLHAKPVALLDVAGYWRALESQIDHMVAEGFLAGATRAIIRRYDEATTMLDELAAGWELPLAEGVVRPDER